MNATQKPAKARKKPVEIEFMLWTGGAAASTPVIDWVLSNGGTARYNELRTHDTAENETTGEIKSFERKTPLPEHIAIDTLEGTMRAEANDIIIRGVNGEFYPCKPDIFRETYDLGRVVE